MSSSLLHFATWKYITTWAKSDEFVATTTADPRLPDPVEDIFDKFGGTATIDLDLIDEVALLFPFCFACLSCIPTICDIIGKSLKDDKKSLKEKLCRVGEVRMNTLMVYAKVTLCAGFLFCLKGLLGASTVLPDSSGWKVCKDRLLRKEGALEWFRQTDHKVTDFFFTPHWFSARYCSDMMYSGHTMTVTLAALGLYELIRVYTLLFSMRGDKKIVGGLLIFMGIVSVGEQLVEIYIVEKSHFHYTIDVIVALIMTLLWYTNGVVAVAAKNWADQDWIIAHSPKFFRDYCIKYKQNLHDQLLKSGKPAIGNWQQHQEYVARHFAQTYDSAGDILIPPCCVPFVCCFLAGRQHIYYDEQVRQMLKLYNKPDDDQDDEKSRAMSEWTTSDFMEDHLRTRMNIGDGAHLFTFARGDHTVCDCIGGMAKGNATGDDYKYLSGNGNSSSDKEWFGTSVFVKTPKEKVNDNHLNV